jgi:DNA-binding NarL/FixJ family response regulator
MMMKTIKVMMVESHPQFRAAIRRLLETTGNMEVVAEASDISEALGDALDRVVDVVIVGAGGSNIAELRTSRALKQWDENVKIIMLPSMNTTEYEEAATRWGLDGCVFQDRDHFKPGATQRGVRAQE